MNASAQIPANPGGQISVDGFLDQVIAALTAADAATLRQLEATALHVGAPASPAGYLAKHATLGALLEASARNLRLIRRVTSRESSCAFTFGPR